MTAVPAKRLRAGVILALVAALLLALGALFHALQPREVRSDDSERTVLGELLSRLLSSDNAKVSVGAVEGALSSDATIRNVVISDRDGPWLRLNEARLVWRRLALLSGRLEVDRLELDRLEILRRPAPAESEAPESDEPLLPELPVEVIVRAFQLKELDLAADVLGAAAKIGADGEARLGDPARGLTFRLEARRLDAPGQIGVAVAFTPAGQMLKLSVRADEPAGGVVARLASIPGLPPVKLDFAGEGPLDQFAARLSFHAGPDLSASGEATVARQQDDQTTGQGGAVRVARVLTLDMNARVSGVLPAPLAPVFAGDTHLGGRVLFNADGSTVMQDVGVTARAAKLLVNGGADAARNLDLTVTAAALPVDDGVLRAGEAEIRRLDFLARVTGKAEMPTVKASLDLAGARLPAGSIGSAKATLDAAPTGVIGERGTRLNVSADAAATGLAFADPGLAAAIGERVSLTLRAAIGRRGTAFVDTFEVGAGAGSAHYQGVAGSRRLDGVLAARVPELAKLRQLTGMRLSGAAALTARLTGQPRFSRVRAELDGEARDLGVGIQAVDGLSGGRLKLSGAVERLPRGGFGFDNLVLEGARASLRLNGRAREDQSAVEAVARIADLRYADRRLTGRGELAANLTGPLTRPDASAVLTLRDGSMLGRPAPLVELKAEATDITGELKATARLSGEIDRKPLTGGLSLARAGAGWSLQDLALAIGSVSARGALTLDGEGLARGALAIRAASLDDASALALRRLAGQLNADLTLTADGGAQDVAIRADGARIRVEDVAIDRLTADLTATDVRRRPAANGFVAVDNAVIAGQTLTGTRLEAKGDGAATDITLRSRAAGLDLSGAARLTPGEPLRLDVTRFDARRGARRIGLAGPASFAFHDGVVDIRKLAVALDSGRLTVEGRAGETLDLNVNVKAVPLAVADIFAPGLGLQGQADGAATVQGPSLAPRGQWRLTLSRLSVAAARAAGLPAASIAASGRLDGAGRTSLEAQVSAARLVDLRVAGSAPLDTGGRLDLAARGRVDLALANAQLSPMGRRLSGQASVDLRLAGAPGAPQLSGGVTLSGGAFSDAVTGLKLERIAGQFAAGGTRVVISRLTAATPNGGSLSVSGEVAVDPAAGFPGNIRLTGDNALLLNDGTARAAADLALTLSGPLALRPLVAGSVGVRSLVINVPNQLPGSLTPLENVRQIDPPPEAKARLALEQKARRQGGGGFDAALDIVVTARGAIRVTGRGINAVLGGQLRIAGTSSAPQPTGGFTLRRGSFDLGSTPLDFTRGSVTFDGTLSPELDFVAETVAAGVTARVSISGPASDPSFEFSSSPSMSTEEIVSRILFGQAAGELSGLEALQLAQIVAQFSGDGDSAFDALRRGLGLGGSDIGADGDQGALARASRALGKRVRVNLKPGATPETTGVGVNVNVSRHIRVQGMVGATGDTSVNVGAEWEY